MKTIIAGSRSITDYNLVESIIVDSEFMITEVVSGIARGVDKLGELWGEKHRITIKKFPADWKGLGKSAGFKRNIQMADYADALIVIILNNSNGSEHMLSEALKRNLRVYVHRINDAN
jgi:hypothetical protein